MSSRQATRKPNKLTPRVKKAILTAIRLGLPYASAAAYAGIGIRTLRQWMRQGERGDAPELARFFQEMEEAQAKAEMYHMTNITGHAKQDWKASAWLLERRWPEKYGRHRVEVTGADGRPVDVRHGVLPDDDTLRRILEA